MDQPKAGENPVSSKKRTSLDAVFGRPEPSDVHPLARRLPGESTPYDRAEPTRGGQPHMKRRPSVKQHTAYLPLSVHEQLRKLAFEENGKIHDYIIEGIDLVFAKRGLSPVSDLIRVNSDTVPPGAE
jgi:hypothetical protein